MHGLAVGSPIAVRSTTAGQERSVDVARGNSHGHLRRTDAVGPVGVEPTTVIDRDVAIGNVAASGGGRRRALHLSNLSSCRSDRTYDLLITGPSEQAATAERLPILSRELAQWSGLVGSVTLRSFDSSPCWAGGVGPEHQLAEQPVLGDDPDSRRASAWAVGEHPPEQRNDAWHGPTCAARAPDPCHREPGRLLPISAAAAPSPRHRGTRLA